MASGPLSALLILVTGLHSCWADGYAKPFGCPSTSISDDLREKVLNTHNELRWFVSQGAQGVVNGFLPQAQNMYRLIWNCTLEDAADRFVKNCNQQPKPGTAYNSKSWPGGAADLAAAVNEWKAQVNQVPVWPQFNKYQTGLNIKEFANMINAKTTGVGCSQATCGNANAGEASCVYDQPELKDNDVIYETGQPCDESGPCTTYPPSVCHDALCRKDVTTTTESTQATTIDPKNTMCPQNVDMNDKTRIRATQMHNYRRSRLAQGQVQKNTGLFLPKGANMIKLTYDCDLESKALIESAKCSGISAQDFNAYRGSPPAAGTRVLAMEEAVKSWWSQVWKVDGPGEKVTFKSHHVNAPIRTFTRMAWANSAKLGCGVTRCHPDYTVVCLYNPRGNNVNEVIYKVGKPCSDCAGAKSCENSLCVF